MDRWETVARDLETSHNDVKWYASVRRVTAALQAAYDAGVREGPSSDPYSPPLGRLNEVEFPAAFPQGDGHP